MTHADFTRLFAYDSWANAQLADALAKAGTPKSMRWLSHVVAVEWLWHARIDGKPAPLPVWPELSVTECREHIERLAQTWKKLLAGAPDLARGASYKNSKGERYTTRLDDILTHVTIHGAHHRGQIVAEIRASGHEPPGIDYILAQRQGLFG